MLQPVRQLPQHAAGAGCRAGGAANPRAAATAARRRRASPGQTPAHQPRSCRSKMPWKATAHGCGCRQCNREHGGCRADRRSHADSVLAQTVCAVCASGGGDRQRACRGGLAGGAAAADGAARAQPAGGGGPVPRAPAVACHRAGAGASLAPATTTALVVAAWCWPQMTSPCPGQCVSGALQAFCMYGPV